jgi:16S rRNA (cytosine967-C5)-methyltransferase
MHMTAREAALKALGLYRQGKALPDKALDGLTGDMPQRESALAKQLLSGVLQNMALCDYYASHFSSIKLKKLEPRVLDILRLSVYQIVFLTKIPHSAAVNEGVALAAKHSNTRAAGFVNAVLRKIADAAEKNSLPAIAGNGESEKLSIEFSHPEWLVIELCESLGSNSAKSFLVANNDNDVPVTAQVNALLADTRDVLASLEADGVRASPHEWLDNCIELRGAGAVDRLAAFQRGHIYIQDAAARLAVLAADPSPGMFVIDGCAAPGGKSFAAAIAMQNTGQVVSCDIAEYKLRRIADGAKRLGIGVIDPVHMDASSAGGEFAEKADVVFADVPCSGVGVIRKKPEIRYKTKQDISGLPDIQKRILLGLSAYVKPGGTLLYSTCSVLRAENEDVIEWFLGANNNFQTDGFSLPRLGNAPSGMCTLLPHIHGTDGFFICKLRRGKGSP